MHNLLCVVLETVFYSHLFLMKPTFSVTRQHKNLCCSPITMTLLMIGSSLLIAFSMGRGGTFSPLAVIMILFHTTSDEEIDFLGRGGGREGGREG